MDPRYMPVARARPFGNPVLGANFTFSPDTSAGVLFQSIMFSITTDATVIARGPFVRVSDGSTNYVQLGCGRAQTAGFTREYSAFCGSKSNNVGTGIDLMDWPTDGLFVPQGHVLTLTALNLQAGDQISAISAYVIEFPTGPRFKMWPFPTHIMEEAE